MEIAFWSSVVSHNGFHYNREYSVKKLLGLHRKQRKLVVGLMSGTSVDGIDAALVEIRGSGVRTRVRLRAFGKYPFPRAIRSLVLASSLPGAGSIDVVCRLNVLLAHLSAAAVKKIARKAGVPLDAVDLIGSHGQTVHHLPGPEHFMGRTIRSTLQLGDPSTLAKLTGIPVVGDFRLGDMALGGQGAPLVPYVDFLLFRSASRTRVLLNLGGIANFTYLPKACNAEDVVAFDTGPANMLIDALMQKLYGKDCDRGGRHAMRGKVVPALLRWMMRHPYLKRRPPKSTGREVFGARFVEELIRRGEGSPADDLIATATTFTALSVYDQYCRFIDRQKVPDEVLVSGGGMHNLAQMEQLRQFFAPAKVAPIEEVGFSSDAKEAVCFAVLANETISGRPSNLPGVTGARATTTLGKICL